MLGSLLNAVLIGVCVCACVCVCVAEKEGEILRGGKDP